MCLVWTNTHTHTNSPFLWTDEKFAYGNELEQILQIAFTFIWEHLLFFLFSIHTHIHTHVNGSGGSFFQKRRKKEQKNFLFLYLFVKWIKIRGNLIENVMKFTELLFF